MKIYQQLQDKVIVTGFKTIEEVFAKLRIHPLILIACCHGKYDDETCRVSVISDKTLTGEDEKLVSAIRALIESQYPSTGNVQ